MQKLIVKCFNCKHEQEIENYGLEFTCSKCHKTSMIDYPLKCWLDFNFLDYLGAILSIIDKDGFELIKAKTQDELKAGKFSSAEVERLRKSMGKAFTEEMTIKELMDDIKKNVKPRDLYKTVDGKIKLNKDGKKILQLSKEWRPAMIARTESTRLANLGAVESFRIKRVKEIVWMASLGERTCQICADLDGKIMDIDNPEVLPPVHVFCFTNWKTSIYTSKGYKFIKDIKIGDLVMTHTGEFKSVSAITPKRNYKGELIEIQFLYNKFKNGKGRMKRVKVTPEHPILTENGWKKANEINYEDKVLVMAKICKECENIYPVLSDYDKDKGFCNQTCSNRYTAKIQWENPVNKQKVSPKISKWNIERYKKNPELGKIITKNAHKKMRELWKDKKFYLMMKENKNTSVQKIIKERGRLHTEKGYKNLKDRKGIKNPRHHSKFSKEYWENDSIRKKKYLQENPEKHINRIIARKVKENNTRSYISKPQLELFYTLKRHFVDAELEYPIKTKKSVRFADVGIPSLKIDIEYDGSYWHQNKDLDDIRDNELIDEGWIVIRFNSNNINEIYNEIDRIKNNHSGNYYFVGVIPHKIIKKNTKRSVNLYNFEVENNESYVANNIVVHNCRCTVINKF